MAIGRVSAAVDAAREAVAHADAMPDSDPNAAFQCLRTRAVHANAVHAAGRLAEAADLFADAERRQKAQGSKYPPELPSAQGAEYCDLLLSRGDAADVKRRAASAVKLAQHNNLLLDIALDTVSLGRAALALSPSPRLRGEGRGEGQTQDKPVPGSAPHPASAPHSVSAPLPSPLPVKNGERGSFENGARGPVEFGERGHLAEAAAYLDAAVDGLHGAGQSWLTPGGYLARAALHRVTGAHLLAKQDLNDAADIADRSGMRLFQCDIALERARLALSLSPSLRGEGQGEGRQQNARSKNNVLQKPRPNPAGLFWQIVIPGEAQRRPGTQGPQIQPHPHAHFDI